MIRFARITGLRPIPPLFTPDPLSRLLGAVRRWRGRASRRAMADEWLLWGSVPRESSDLLAWRARELTSWENRVELARLCRRLVAELGDPRCRAYAVNRAALRAHRHLLVRLTERLEDSDETVSPRGVILASRVLRDGAGPLFDTARADELGPSLAAALDVLDDTAQARDD